MVDNARLEKLKELKELGISAFPYTYRQQKHASEIVAKFDKLNGKKVSVAGRVMRLRQLGKLYFMDLFDSSGKIQIMARPESVSSGSAKLLGLLDVGDIIGVSGVVTKSNSGEISVDAATVTLLAKSLMQPPEKFHGLSDVELRYRKRYLDIMSNQEARRIFVYRAKIIDYIRNFLNKRGYLEVETPILQPVYGGAFAEPFITHHNYLDVDMYLRISNELYLKRLIIGGYERVYEFSKDFRNEAVDANHNPEFTLLEFYEAYSDYNTFMKLTEKLLSGMVKKLYGSYDRTYQGKTISFKPPFKRIYLVDEIKKKSGIDIAELTDDAVEEIAKKEGIDLAIKNRYHLADALFDKYVQKDLSDPTFVLDYPTYMCSLTKDKRGDSRLSERFELFVAGKEIANCYSELTDPIQQRAKFEEEDAERRKGDPEAPPIDFDFIEAMEYGMPPTAGIGIGIDRLVMLLENVGSIKEVILFPTTKPQAPAQAKGSAEVGK
ncbi:MAG: lysine--tRNA ligase [Candidatus Micrarchaeia archaeon]